MMGSHFSAQLCCAFFIANERVKGMNVIKKLKSRYSEYKLMKKERAEEASELGQLFMAAANLAVEELGAEMPDEPVVSMSEEEKAYCELTERFVYRYIERYFPMKETVHERAERWKRIIPIPFFKWYIERNAEDEVSRRSDEIKKELKEIKKEEWEAWLKEHTK